MSESEQSLTQADGRLASAVRIIKGLVAEDPLMALIGLCVILPLAGLLIEGVRSMNTPLIILVILVLGGIIIFVYIPLIIAKTWKNVQKDMKNERKKAITDRRTLEKATWEVSQERANIIINAKVLHLQAQADFLFKQGEHWEKFLIHKAADDLREAVDARLEGEMTFISKTEFVDKYTLFNDVLKELNLKYDNLITSFPKVMDEIEELAKGKITSTPEFKFKPDPEIMEQSYLSQIQARDTLIKDLQAKLDDALGPPVSDEEIKNQDAEFEKIRQPDPEEVIITSNLEESTISKDHTEIKDALKVVSGILDDIDDLGDTPDEKLPEELPDHPPELPPKINSDPNDWHCKKCGKTFSSNVKRCTNCAISQNAARNLMKIE